VLPWLAPVCTPTVDTLWLLLIADIAASAEYSDVVADAEDERSMFDKVTLGSQTAALQFDQQNSENASKTLTSTASNITDADIAKTAATYAREKTASQIQVALQVRANLAASSVLGLFPR
jgi:flagellin-like hook-associated protein FlgL